MKYTVNSLIDLVKKSEQYRDKYLKDRALRNIDWYNGDFPHQNYSSSSNIDFSELNYYVNLTYSTTRTIVTSIYNRFPEYSFFLQGDLNRSILDTYGIAVKLQTTKLERVLEMITKVYFREMHAQRTNRLAITDAVLMGFGATKLGYNVDFDEEKRLLFEQNYRIPENKSIELASNIEISELVTRNEPYLLRVHPLNLLFPTDAEGFNRLPWVCEVIYKDKDEAEKMYGVEGQLSAGYYPTYMERDNMNKNNCNIVKLYEFHSLDPAQPNIYVFSEGYDKFLEKKTHPLYNEKTGKVKNMYDFIWFNESYKSIYPPSDIDLVQSEIREAIYQTQKRVEHVRKWVSQLIIQGVIDEKEKMKLVSGEDGTYIHLLNTDARISVVERANLSQDFYNNIISIRNEIYETLGLSDYAVGGHTQERKATEAQFIERSFVNRLQERIDIIEKFSFDQVDLFVEIMKEYEQVGRLFNIALGDERLSFIFAGELLQMSDIQIQVVPGSTVSLDRDAEIRRMEQLGILLGNANLQVPGMIKMGKFYKDMLNKLGYAGDEYINEQATGALPPGMNQNIPQIPQQQNQPNIPTPTPMQQSRLPGV